MSEKITVPTLGESVTEATVSKWLKSQGEKVAVDEPIVELETDKVNVEVPAPSNGFLGSIDVKEGETVNVGSILGTINDNAKNISLEPKELKSYSPPKKEPKLFDEKKIVSQKFFLEKMGIIERAKILEKNMNIKQLDYMSLTLKRLLHKDLMGSLFKVIFAFKNKRSDFLGFE